MNHPRATAGVLSLALLGAACSSEDTAPPSPTSGTASATTGSSVASSAGGSTSNTSAVSGAGGAASGSGGSAGGGGTAGTSSAGAGGGPNDSGAPDRSDPNPDGDRDVGSTDALADRAIVDVAHVDSPSADAGKYPLRYEQTFAAATSLADMVFSNPAQWSHNATDGGFLSLNQPTGYTPPFPSPTSIAVVALGRFGSLEMDVEVMQTGVDYAHRDHCLFFGIQDPTHFYYAHVSSGTDAVAHQIHIVNNAARRAITTTRSNGYDWGRDVWRHLRLVRDLDSGLIEVYGEGVATPLLRATDKTFGVGYVGVGSFDDVGRVRNLRIWSDQFVTVRPPFFTAKP